MSLNYDLKAIKNNISNVKDTLDAALTGKGATAGATLTESVNAVNSIPQPKIQEEKNTVLNGNGEVVLTASDGYDVMKKVNLTISVPAKVQNKKTVEITSNGTTELTPQSPYTDGYRNITINTNVPSAGGLDFSVLGYDAKSSQYCTNYIEDGIAYAEKIKQDYENRESWEKASIRYLGDKNLIFMPNIDCTNVEYLNDAFNGCNRLIYVPPLNIVPSKLKGCMSAFSACYSLKEVPYIDTSFSPRMQSYISSSANLECVRGFSVKSYTNNTTETWNEWGDYNYLRYLLIKDLGTFTDKIKYPMNVFKVWGIADEKYPDARQSLTDTLITYSFDRKTAGYEACTISISTDTNALLTEEEKATIANKGFTLVVE